MLPGTHRGVIPSEASKFLIMFHDLLKGVAVPADILINLIPIHGTPQGGVSHRTGNDQGEPGLFMKVPGAFGDRASRTSQEA